MLVNWRHTVDIWSVTIKHAVDVLAALRSATAERHALLDAGLAIGRPGATLADYQRHLCMLQAWLGPLEGWLAGFRDGPQVLLDARQRLKIIEADLADLADSALPPAPGRAPDPLAWPAHAGAAYRWGVCYVIEGSQLGGAVLYQRLAAAMAPHPLRYLKGDTDGPGPRWRQFMLALRDHVRTDADVQQACHGARDAFDRILALR